MKPTEMPKMLALTGIKYTENHIYEYKV